MGSRTEVVSNKDMSYSLEALGALLPDHMLILLACPSYYPSHFTEKKTKVLGSNLARWMPLLPSHFSSLRHDY